MSAGRGRAKAREPLRPPEEDVLRRIIAGGVSSSEADQSPVVSTSHDSSPTKPHTSPSDTQTPSSPSPSPGKRTVARGRGRGRATRQSENTEQPTQPGGLSSTPLEPASEVSPSQFDSINDEHTPVLQTPPPSSSSSPPPTLSPDTSCANSKTIPLASEIKEAVNQGVKVANEVQPATPESSSVVSGKKMNPDAPTFVPGNSPTSGVSPSLPGKHPPVSSEQGNSMSELNPNVKEFVPSGKSSMLNVAAADFVPSPRLLIVENGDPDQFYPPVEEIDFDPLQKDVGTTELAMQDPKYLTEGFYKPASVLESDVGYENLLEYCAEILVKATLYPDSFENRKQILQTMMSSRQLSEGAYTNLAEMLIHWGITESWLYYTSCKLSDILCNGFPAFRQQYLKRFNQWFHFKRDLPVDSEEDRYAFLNFCMFLAEMFSRIKVGGVAINVLGQGVFEMLTRLLGIADSVCVGGACNILKLTGALLIKCKDGAEKMEVTMSTVKSLQEKPNLDSKSNILMRQVLQLHASSWDYEAPPTVPPPSTADSEGGDKPAYQPPVTNPEEWNEFLLEDQYCEETDSFDGGIDPGIDPEMEHAYEAFIEEMEEHLMRQELGD